MISLCSLCPAVANSLSTFDNWYKRRINIIEPAAVNGMSVVALLRREAKCKKTLLKPAG